MKKMYLFVIAFLFALALPVYAQDDPTPADAPVEEIPADEQPPIVVDEPPAEEPDPAVEALAFWFAMAAAVTGFLEQVKTIVLKPLQNRYGLSDDVYGFLAMLIAFVASLVLVFTIGDGRTLFDEIGLTISNVIVAQIATAFVVSLGNQALHLLYNFFLGWRAPILAIEEADVTVTTNTSGPTTTTAFVEGSLIPQG